MSKLLPNRKLFPKMSAMPPNSINRNLVSDLQTLQNYQAEGRWCTMGEINNFILMLMKICLLMPE